MSVFGRATRQARRDRLSFLDYCAEGEFTDAEFDVKLREAEWGRKLAVRERLPWIPLSYSGDPGVNGVSCRGVNGELAVLQD